jgi:thioredoxin 1
MMSAYVINTDDQGFDATVLQAREPVLVDFWNEGCPPCRMIAPVLEELAREYQGRLRIVKVNADESPDTQSRYGIRAVPTLVFFEDGRESRRIVGAWPKAKFVAVFEQVLATAGSRAS